MEKIKLPKALIRDLRLTLAKHNVLVEGYNTDYRKDTVTSDLTIYLYCMADENFKPEEKTK